MNFISYRILPRKKWKRRATEKFPKEKGYLYGRVSSTPFKEKHGIFVWARTHQEEQAVLELGVKKS